MELEARAGLLDLVEETRFGSDCERAGPPPTRSRHPSALFQVVALRYLKGSIVLTSNRGITAWARSSMTAVAAATLDRLLHRVTVVAIYGESHRLRIHQTRADRL